MGGPARGARGRPRVVILGGGFAGVYAAPKLSGWGRRLRVA